MPQVKELRIFECGHSYHKKCIDNLINSFLDDGKSENSDADSGAGDNFFDKRRDNKLSMYESFKLDEARKKAIQCIRCKKFSLRDQDI